MITYNDISTRLYDIIDIISKLKPLFIQFNKENDNSFIESYEKLINLGNEARKTLSQFKAEYSLDFVKNNSKEN